MVGERIQPHQIWGKVVNGQIPNIDDINKYKYSYCDFEYVSNLIGNKEYDSIIDNIIYFIENDYKYINKVFETYLFCDSNIIMNVFTHPTIMDYMLMRGDDHKMDVLQWNKGLIIIEEFKSLEFILRYVTKHSYSLTGIISEFDSNDYMIIFNQYIKTWKSTYSLSENFFKNKKFDINKVDEEYIDIVLKYYPFLYKNFINKTIELSMLIAKHTHLLFTYIPQEHFTQDLIKVHLEYYPSSLRYLNGRYQQEDWMHKFIIDKSLYKCVKYMHNISIKNLRLMAKKEPYWVVLIYGSGMSEEVAWMLIKHHPSYISDVKNQTTEMCLYVASKDKDSIRGILNHRQEYIDIAGITIDEYDKYDVNVEQINLNYIENI